MILKLIKIRDLGMENGVFVVCFKVCLRGVSRKISITFLCFLN